MVLEADGQRAGLFSKRNAETIDLRGYMSAQELEEQRRNNPIRMCVIIVFYNMHLVFKELKMLHLQNVFNVSQSQKTAQCLSDFIAPC